jgi:hypothetical protein
LPRTIPRQASDDDVESPGNIARLYLNMTHFEMTLY